MNNKTIIEFGFVSFEELWRSQRVLSTLLDLHNSSDDTQPHSIIIVNYFEMRAALK